MLPRIQTEQAEIDLDVAVRRLNSAQRQNALAQANQAEISWRQAGQPQRDIRFNRCTHLRRPVDVDAEAAVGELAVEDRARGFVDKRSGLWLPPPIIRRVEPKLKEDEIGFQRAVGGQFRAPVPIARL